MKKRCILFGLLAVILATSITGQGTAGKLRYVNPLSIEDTRSIADPTVLRFQGKYYLFLSGGMVWSSDDLVHWKHQPATMPPGRRATAPATLNTRATYTSQATTLGFFVPVSPSALMSTSAILRTTMARRCCSSAPWFSSMKTHACTPTIPDAIPTASTVSNSTVKTSPALQRRRRDSGPSTIPHVWERYGDNNEGAEVTWLEAPWMTKHNSKYYLQYSAPGTEWKTYAVGVYTAKSPLGPFTYAQAQPNPGSSKRPDQRDRAPHRR